MVLLAAAVRATLPLAVPISVSVAVVVDGKAVIVVPAGIPVPTLAIGKPGAINASLACLSVLGNKYPSIKKKLITFRNRQTNSIKKNPQNVK